MVLTDEHRLLARVLNRVVLSDDIGGSVNPQAVPATDGTDGVAVEFNHRATNTNTGAFAGTGNGVAFSVDFSTVVGGQTCTLFGRDDVVFDLEGVLNVAGGLEGIGVNSVALDRDF